MLGRVSPGQGCGNSELAERLVTAHGLRAGSGSSIQVEAVDYSPLIVEHMAQHTEPLVSQCVLQYQVRLVMSHKPCVLVEA